MNCFGAVDPTGLVALYDDVGSDGTDHILSTWHKSRPQLVCNCVVKHQPRLTVRAIKDGFVLATFPGHSIRHSTDCRWRDQPSSVDEKNRLQLQPISIKDEITHGYQIIEGDSLKLSSHNSLDRLLIEIWCKSFEDRSPANVWQENAKRLVHTVMNLNVYAGGNQADGSSESLANFLRVSYFPDNAAKISSFLYRQRLWFEQSSERGEPSFVLGRVESISSRPDARGGGVRIALSGFKRPIVILQDLWERVVVERDNVFMEPFLSDETDYCRLAMMKIRLGGKTINDPIFVDDVGLALVVDSAFLTASPEK